MVRYLLIGLIAIAPITTKLPQQRGKPDISLKESKRISPYPPAAVKVTKGKLVVVIDWKEVPLARIVAYEIFRSVNHGPFKKIGRVKGPPFIDKPPTKADVVYAVASVDRDNSRSKLMEEARP